MTTRREGSLALEGTDGSPLKAVDVRIDGGGWRPAQLWKENTPYSWKLFTYTWPDAPAGDHTMVSRAIDVHGRVQPERDDPANTTRWENNAQFVRTITLP